MSYLEKEMDYSITKIKAIQVLDSRGNPTIETEVFTKSCSRSAIVPSGASTGTYEAKELRDNEKAYHGRSVLKVVNNIQKIEKLLKNKDVRNQRLIDSLMIKLDGTKDKSNLGANTILSVSLASSRCAANLLGKSLYKYLGNKTIMPIPFCNVINGGKHAGNNLNFQEFMIAPIKAKSFSQATQMVCEVYQTLKQNIEKKYGKSAINVGDEGGFAPNIIGPTEAFELILKAIEENGYQNKIGLAMDAAASEFHDANKNRYFICDGNYLDRYGLVDYYIQLIRNYKLISLEDPFDQEDYAAWHELKQKIGIQIVGDDLLVTNTERIKEAVKEKLCNCLLLKVNQIGTLSESLDAADLAFKNKWNVMVSHRSGETEDTFIADLAVALGCGQIKLGAPARGERTCKFNRLLRIEKEINKPRYAKF